MILCVMQVDSCKQGQAGIVAAQESGWRTNLYGIEGVNMSLPEGWSKIVKVQINDWYNRYNASLVPCKASMGRCKEW